MTRLPAVAAGALALLLATTLVACGDPGAPSPDPSASPTPGSGSADGATPIPSIGTLTEAYLVTGGDGKYQFSGYLCADYVSGSLEPVPGDVDGNASIPGPDYPDAFSFKWITGNFAHIDSGSGHSEITEQTADAITIVASYSGYASIGDGGTNTEIAGTMTFTGTSAPPPDGLCG